ncbi:MAG TPA: DMT family transporter [Patescibacteria group bacterium]|nr:DMT family transporter [Patescibacteria group bacterium]
MQQAPENRPPSTPTAAGHQWIYLMLLTIVVLWGINVVMIKYLTQYYHPLALAAIRLSLATFLLVPVAVRQSGRVTPPQSSWVPITGVVIFSIYLHHTTLAWGIASTSATHASLILGLNPLLTTVLASYFIGEAFTWIKAVAIILGFSGVSLIVSGQSVSNSTSLNGDIIMLVSTLAAAIGSLFIKKSTALLSPLLVTAYSHLAASAALVLTAAFAVPVWIYDGAFAPVPVAIILFSSFINTALGALWWNTGIQKVGASTTSLFQNGIPVAGMFASALFLNEVLGAQHFTALALVLLGVSLGTGLLKPLRLLSALRSRLSSH